MPKTTGISRFMCDRTSCGKEEYLAESDTKSKQWMEVERQDGAFNEFMAAKKEA